MPTTWAQCRVAGRFPLRTRSLSTTRSRAEEVNFAGEIVAVVVARSAAAARDATELVDVEYDDEQVVLDLEAAAAGAPYVHPDWETNVSTHWVFDSAEAGTGSDVKDEIEKARQDGIVLERTFRQQRLIPAFMEPRSFLVDPTGDQIVFWSSTQVPHFFARLHCNCDKHS